MDRGIRALEGAAARPVHSSRAKIRDANGARFRRLRSPLRNGGARLGKTDYQRRTRRGSCRCPMGTRGQTACVRRGGHQGAGRRMTGPAYRPLNSVSLLAMDAGLGSKPAGGTIAPCPDKSGSAASSGGAGGNKAKPLEYCDIKMLRLALTAQDKTATITIDRNRRVEGVAPNVASAYRGLLSSYDLVIEALSDVRDETEQAGRSFVSSDCRPLEVTATAQNSVSHTSFAPAHPHVELQTSNYMLVQSDGGAPVKATYFAPRESMIGGSAFGWLCPHSRERIREYPVWARSCGNLPIPQKPITSLSARLVVLPYEENTIEIGAPAKVEYSKESTGMTGEKDGDSSRSVTRTTTVMKRTGNSASTTKTEAMETPSGSQRTRVTQTNTTLEPHLLLTDSKSVSTIKQSWNGKKTGKKSSKDWDARKVTVKRKIGGIESTFNAGSTIKKIDDTIEAILAVKDVADKVQAVFKSVKIGWSFSVGYELLVGKLALSWGNRWPSAWAEDNRIYYVERYCRVTGTVEPINGNVTGFFGFAVDPWYAPVSIEIGAYLELKFESKISGNNTLAWTNPNGSVALKPYKFDASGKLSAEAGAKANGRAFGYSVTSRFAVEGEANLTFDGAVGGGEAFYLRSSLVIGKESDTQGGKRLDAIRLVGEVICTGRTIRRHQIEPIGLVKGGKVWEDYYHWGEKPREG
ncbi:hypothetical protein N0B51_04065 [Tsuneonella sp. YG55]|uniref:Uncharacterized protein n=1 Tax=Tsuneonella litorea TaxID=2976475 RepID=A0A9X2VZC2_9SPHN|nr:hypothetical protein [Tsuneonella litorea]MCT2558147.1 hypothetical protein [Tsuneonella litorea]